MDQLVVRAQQVADLDPAPVLAAVQPGFPAVRHPDPKRLCVVDMLEAVDRYSKADVRRRHIAECGIEPLVKRQRFGAVRFQRFDLVDECEVGIHLLMTNAIDPTKVGHQSLRLVGEFDVQRLRARPPTCIGSGRRRLPPARRRGLPAPPIRAARISQGSRYIGCVRSHTPDLGSAL